MKVKLKGILAGLLVAGVLTGCSGGTSVGGGKAQPESKIDNPAGLGYVGKYGKVTVIKEGEDFILKKDPNIEYELTDVKLVKIQNFSEDAKLSLVMSGAADNISSLPKSLYAIIGKEKKVNKTDEEIEFPGIHTVVVGSQQIDVFVSDFVIEDVNNSYMHGGVKMNGEFGFVVEDPNIKEAKFVLSASFDSNSFSREISPETQFKIEFSNL